MAEAVSRLAEELADAIATGAQVDWDELRRRQERLGSPPLLENLCFLASRLRLEGAPGVEDAPPPAWQRLVAGAAGLQISAGLLGAAVGEPLAHVARVLPYLAILTFAGAGAWLYLGAPRDARVRHLGIFFLLMATAPAQVPLRALLASLPLGWAGAWLAHVHLDALLPLFLWLFVRDFPRTLRVGRDAPVVRAGVALSGLAGAVLLLANVGLAAAGGRWAPAGIELAELGRSHPGGGYWTTVLVLMLLALPVPILRARGAPRHEIARVRFFGVALAVALFPLVADNLASFVSPAWDELSGRPETGVVTAPVVYAFLLTLPIATSWAILRHGTLEVRDLLRGALRVALARWTLRALTGGVLLASAVLVYRHRDVSLGDLAATAEGATLMVLAGAGVLLLAGRESLLLAVEGALTGRGRAWRRRAARPLARIRYARSFGELHECLDEGVRAAIPGAALELLARREGEPWYGPLTPGFAPLAADTALLSMLGAAPAPLRVQAEAEPSWFRWLPERERQWVVESRAALLAPLTARSGEPIALVVVREPEQPLAIESDALELLEELAAAAGPVAEGLLQGAAGSVARALSEEPGVECPGCGVLFEAGERPCGCAASPVRALLPRVLGGKFELHRVLGSGGMGRVYLAEELALGRRVALKAMPRRSASASVVLRREARAMAAVSHPNLASIHGLETWREVPVLVVEYLPGGTLAQRLGAPADAPAALRLAGALADGLCALHAAGIAHRDIKPTNVAFAADGTPKLLDFGLSRPVSHASGDPAASLAAPEALASSAAGTPLYLSPELLRSEEVSLAEQDLWALAIVLYEVLAGRHPLRLVAGDPLERLVGGDVPPPAWHLKDQGEDVAGFLSRCLGRDRERRPASAEAFRDEVRALLAARRA